jgi:hypothetical protein
MRSHTPASPLLPPKPGRLSSSTPSIARTMSEEKAEAHERWLPPELVADPTKGRTGFSNSAFVAQRLFDLNGRGKTPAPR